MNSLVKDMVSVQLNDSRGVKFYVSQGSFSKFIIEFNFVGDLLCYSSASNPGITV
jgi:hypothetical protein